MTTSPSATLLHLLSTILPHEPYRPSDDLSQILDANFSLLQEGQLQQLFVTLQQSTAPHHPVLLDALHNVLQQRKEWAAEALQRLVTLGKEGDVAGVDQWLQSLHRQRRIDCLLTSLIGDTQRYCQAQGNEDMYYMLVYCLQSIERLGPPLPPPCPLPTPESKPESRPDSTREQASSEIESEEDALRRQRISAALELANETAVIAASETMMKCIKDAAGDAKQLLQRMQALVDAQDIDLPALLIALKDNIDACRAANYENKLKLFLFLQQHFQDYQTVQQQASHHATAEENDEIIHHLSMYHAPQFVAESTLSSATSSTPGHVLPVPFLNAHGIDILAQPKNKKNKVEKKAIRQRITQFVTQVSAQLSAEKFAVIDHFLPLELVRRVRIEANLFRDYYENAEIWVGKRSDVGAHITVPSVRGDRVLWMCGGQRVIHDQQDSEQGEEGEEDEDEMKGKAEEGGQASSRPSPLSSAPNQQPNQAKRDKKKKKKAKNKSRDNRQAVEGVTRSVQIFGEVEPCKLEIKAAAPLKKFFGIKELKLVDELKLHSTDCQRIYERSDAMLSIYPGEGARFARHIDNTTSDGRRLTLVLYLNPGWTDAQGGALRISLPDAPPVDVFPAAGRAVLFLSSQVPHEVLPTFGDRHAVTIWYYDRIERQAALQRALAAETKPVKSTSTSAQREAQQFIALLMGGDDIGVDGGDVTPDELQCLQQQVQRLSPETVEIVASITGAPSPQSFVDGFALLTTTDVKSMRALFRRMGLN